MLTKRFHTRDPALPLAQHWERGLGGEGPLTGKPTTQPFNHSCPILTGGEAKIALNALYRHESLVRVCGPLLAPVFLGGGLVYESMSLDESRARTLDQLGKLHPGIKRPLIPCEYPAGQKPACMN